MFEKKYAKILVGVQAELDEDPKSMKMNARLISSMQEVVQNSIQKELPYGEIMELFKANVGEFFEKFNEFLVRHFEFERINNFVASGGSVEFSE